MLVPWRVCLFFPDSFSETMMAGSNEDYHGSLRASPGDGHQRISRKPPFHHSVILNDSLCGIVIFATFSCLFLMCMF